MKFYYLKTTLTVAKGPALLAKATKSEEQLKKSGITDNQIKKLVNKGVLVETDEPTTQKQAAPVERTDGNNKEPQSHSPVELEKLTVPVLQGKYKEEISKYPAIEPKAAPKTKDDLVEFLSSNYTGD